MAVNAAGCGSAMKEYGRLLADDPEWAERAEAFAGKVKDVTEMLAGVEPRAPRHPIPMTVAYHDACHLAHAQKVRAEPRQVLGRHPGLTVLQPAEWEIFCGSAGLYNMLEPEPAAELGRRKVANLTATGAAGRRGRQPGLRSPDRRPQRRSTAGLSPRRGAGRVHLRKEPAVSLYGRLARRR